MPLEDLLPKSAIDELYEKYVGSKVDYITLRTELETINASLANRDANIYHDSSDLTYAAANRKDKQYASIPKRIVKDRFYGIVLYKTGDFNKEVYVDVPGKTAPILDPDIFYTDPELDLSKYKEYLFEPSSLDYYSTPVIGGIAVVKVPKNFPDHVNTNAEDAIYLHMKRPDILVAIKDSGETGRPPLGGGSGGGLGAVNGTAASTDEAAPTAPADQSAPVDSATSPSTNTFASPDGKKEASLVPDPGKLSAQPVLGYWYGKSGTIYVTRLVDIYSIPGDEGPQFLQEPATNKFHSMMASWDAYKNSLPPAEQAKIKKNIRIWEPKANSTFRSNRKQKDLYDGWIKRRPRYNPANRPGYSNHQYGLAVDISGTHPNGNSKSNGPYGKGAFYEWLIVNGPTYGFKRTVSSEYWHWEFRHSWVGSPKGQKGNGLDPSFYSTQGTNLNPTR